MISPLFENIKSNIIADLRKAKDEINIAVAWFTNHEFFEILMNKLESGIEVNVILINDAINNRIGGLNWQEFINSGGKLYFSTYPNIMHHKFCIIDRKILYNGSYNWTYSAEIKNKENTIKHTRSTKLISDFHNEFMFLKSLYKEPKRIRPFSSEYLLTLKQNKVISSFIQHEFNSSEKAKKKNGQLFFEKNQTSKKKFSNNISSSRFENLRREIISKETNTLPNAKSKSLNNKTTLTSTNSKRNISSLFQEKSNIDNSLHSKLLDEIKQDGYKGKFGLLRINLKWNTKDDLDLAVLDPNGRKISYQNTSAISQGSIGKLDLDANASATTRNPQENIFWENNPPEGYYKIYTTHFNVNERKNVPFVLSIISKKGKSDILEGNIYHGKMNTKLLAIIHYSRLKGVTSITKKNILIDAS